MAPNPNLESTLLNPRLLVVRGVLSILFGILALAWPGPGLLAIALLFGAYAFFDGVLAIGTGVRRGRQGWILPVLEGIIGIAAGIVTVLWPAITLFVLSIFVGAWALVTGAFEVLAALSYRDVMPRSTRTARALLAIAGFLSIALGVVVFVSPAVGVIALLMFVATYSLFFGIVLTALGIRLGRAVRKHEVKIESPSRAA